MLGARETAEDPHTREIAASWEHLGSSEVGPSVPRRENTVTKPRGLCFHSWSLFNQIGLRERTNSTMTAGPSTRTHLLISASGMVAEGEKSLLGHPKCNPSIALQMTIAMSCTRKQLKSYLRFWSRCILLSKE